MSKTYDSLPVALKAVITQEGKDVIKDIRLANILNDLLSFEDFPASKAVLRQLLMDGYGEKIYKIIYENNLKETKIEKLKTKLVSSEGYSDDVINYIISSILYGLNISNSKPIHQQSSQTFSGTFNFEKELERLKGEYSQALEELITVPDGYSGYFTVKAKSDLYAIEGKINVLSTVLGKNCSKWCKAEYDRVLDKYQEIEENKSMLKGLFKKVFG